MNKEATKITISSTIDSPVGAVWKKWNDPDDIKNWNNASADWHTPKAENDLRKGGRFNYRMEARDGSAGFDFFGTYDNVIQGELIEYTIGDGRKVKVVFFSDDGKTKITTTFDAENQNPVEMQKNGWQSILDNFKKYCENN